MSYTTRNSVLISGCGFDGRFARLIFGSSGEAAVDEFGACTDERDQVRAVDGAPAGLRGFATVCAPAHMADRGLRSPDHGLAQVAIAANARDPLS